MYLSTWAAVPGLGLRLELVPSLLVAMAYTIRHAAPCSKLPSGTCPDGWLGLSLVAGRKELRVGHKIHETHELL